MSKIHLAHLAPPDWSTLLLTELLDDVVAELARDGDALRGRHHRAHLLFHEICAELFDGILWKEHLKKVHLLLDLLALLLGHDGALLPLNETAVISQLSLTNLKVSKLKGGLTRRQKFKSLGSTAA